MRRENWQNCRISIKNFRYDKFFIIKKQCMKPNCSIKEPDKFITNDSFKYVKEIDCIENNCKKNKIE